MLGGGWNDRTGGIEVSLLTSAATEIRGDGLDGAGTVVGDFCLGSGRSSKAGCKPALRKGYRGPIARRIAGRCDPPRLGWAEELAARWAWRAKKRKW